MALLPLLPAAGRSAAGVFAAGCCCTCRSGSIEPAQVRPRPLSTARRKKEHNIENVQPSRSASSEEQRSANSGARAQAPSSPRSGPADREAHELELDLNVQAQYDIWASTASYGALRETQLPVEENDWLAMLTDGRASTRPMSIDGGIAAGMLPRRRPRAPANTPSSSELPRRSLSQLRWPAQSPSRGAHTAAASAEAFASGSDSDRTSASSFAREYASHPLRFPTHLSHATPYDVFHLPRSASAREIKARYYELVKLLHPDRHFSAASAEDGDGAADGDASAKAHEQAQKHFKVVVAAYEILRDAGKRSLYDRTGLGWSESPGGSFAASGPTPPWWGGRPPRTPEEWAAWNAWSAHLRRTAAAGGSSKRTGWEFRGSAAAPHGAPRGHDAFGWQRQATGEDWSFYGFSAREREAARENETRITTNRRLFGAIVLATWFIAALQYQRLSRESQRAVERADKHHLDAVKSLTEARESARSREGRWRHEAMRRRARESSVLREVERLESSAGHAPVPHFDAAAASTPLLLPSGPSIGHGGPSGKEAHDERRERHERMMKEKEQSGQSQPQH